MARKVAHDARTAAASDPADAGHIPVAPETRRQLDAMRRPGESYDDVIRRLLRTVAGPPSARGPRPEPSGGDPSPPGSVPDL